MRNRKRENNLFYPKYLKPVFREFNILIIFCVPLSPALFFSCLFFFFPSLGQKGILIQNRKHQSSFLSWVKSGADYCMNLGSRCIHSKPAFWGRARKNLLKKIPVFVFSCGIILSTNYCLCSMLPLIRLSFFSHCSGGCRTWHRAVPYQPGFSCRLSSRIRRILIFNEF